MTQLATLSATCLNQFALDFEGNYGRILKSIEISKRQGAKLRCGPELEICGYDCEDHFYESDTLKHCWQVLIHLLKQCEGILVDVGMPVIHNGVTYNCRVIFLDRKILLIRPKMAMCEDGNYRESRWFTAWTKKRQVEDFYLPANVASVTSQTTVPIGDALLRLNDTTIGFEICEELWSPNSSHIHQSLAGAEIIINGSGSHAEIRKSSWALDLIQTASSKCGIVYVFNNMRGCDGERLYFNGCPSVTMNGKVLALGEQYSLLDIEVLTTTVDLDEIREYKTSIRSRSLQSDAAPSYPMIPVDWSLRPSKKYLQFHPTQPLKNVEFCCAEEEIGRGPALWLWDYLRRSPASGFFLPLSGGVDSSSVALIVYSMCDLIVNFISKQHEGSDIVTQDVRKVLRDETYVPKSAKELCGRLLTTCYMGSKNSSSETKNRAEALAASIGSCHSDIDISSAVSAFEEVATKHFGKKPEFTGTPVENLALQNIQARSRMVYAYLLAQLTPWARESKGFLLVLGTSNVDEAIRGYFTKYDCSSADLNPIGGISKTDLKSFVLYTSRKFNLDESVQTIVHAPPTAELQPLESNQTDERDMGMTYEELSIFGNLRKIQKCGPFSMVARLLHLWSDKHEPAEVARKVKHFYVSYASNRHKMTTLTPSVHMENYSPEDHRFDLRPIFYPLDFTWQFREIDALVKHAELGTDASCEVD